MKDICHSYSFSFQLKTCQDIRYFRKTTPNNTLKNKIEKFVLSFIKDYKNSTDESTTRGRPKKDKIISIDDKYIPFQFPLKKSTIRKIRDYKRKEDVPNLDKNVEEYIKLIVPSRILR